MLAKFDIIPGLTWDKRRLIVPMIPNALKNNLKGKPAKEVVEHPITELLGPIKRVTDMKWRQTSAITFELERKKIAINP